MKYKWLIWSVLGTAGIAGAWYWYESRWDRRLFTAAAGCVCANLSADEAKSWLLAHPDTQVLDVRSAREFAGGALPGAVNISIGGEAFDARMAAFDRETAVLVYCAGGFRSRKAVERLKQLGFRNIQHIHRGYMSWKPDQQP